MNQPTSFNAARADLAKGLKTLLSTHEAKISSLRARELKKSAGNKALSKNELCLLCSNDPKSCTCLLRKAEGGTCTSCSRPLTGHLAPDNTVCGFCKARPPKAKKDETDMSLSERCSSELGKNDDMVKGEGCKECGGVGSHPKTCSLALKNPKIVKKDELPIVKPAPEKAVSGAKLPGTPKKQDLGDGSGDGTKLGKRELRKALPTLPGMAKPTAPAAAVVGVPGKQPVGQGGGDKHKVPQAAPPTPVAQVNKELGGMKSIASNPTAMPGGKLANPPKPLAPVAGNTPKPVSGSFVARKDELSSDKRAGGVGWLNSLHASLSAPKPKAPTNDVMLVRDKMNMGKPTGASAAPAGAGPVLKRPSPRAGITGAAALARGEKSPAKKMEGPAPAEGLNSANHNRRLLSIRR